MNPRCRVGGNVRIARVFAHSTIVVVAMLLLAGCGDLLAPAAAVVNDHKITVDEVNDGVAQLEETPQFKQLAEQGDVDAFKREFEQTYLSQLIRRAVFEPQAAELGVEVTDADVTERLDEIKANFPSTSAFEESVKEQGVTLEQLPVLVRDNLLAERLRAEVVADVQPSEEELRANYRENIEDHRETRAQHILVDSQRQAAEIAARLRAAPRTNAAKLFAALAREFSTDRANAKKGGDLGFFSVGQFVKPFEDAAAALDVGQISNPVETEFGWHIIRVTDRRNKPFDDVREQIAEDLAGPAQDDAWEKWVIDAYEAADVEVNPRYGELDIETQVVVNPPADSIPGVDVTPAPAATEL
jgi:peptidyl-prolyl cis-trans isomerase C